MAGMPDTLAQPVSHTLEVKHSRFIAHAAPIDGAAAGARIIFNIIMGTGCGGGVVVDGKIIGVRSPFSQREWMTAAIRRSTPRVR